MIEMMENLELNDKEVRKENQRCGACTVFEEMPLSEVLTNLFLIMNPQHICENCKERLSTTVPVILSLLS